MDERDIKRSFPKLRWMGDEDRHVWINKQNHKKTEKDGRCEEPFENLAEMWTLDRMRRKVDGYTQVMAHAAMTKFASTKG